MSSLSDRQSAPRTDLLYATIGHSDALLAAIRKRIDELQITYETLEAVSGCQSGYCTKILGNPPAKRVQLYTAFLLIEALGLRVKLEEDPELTEGLRHRWTRRRFTKAAMRPAGSIKEFPPDFYRYISRLGNEARWRKLGPERRSALARNAAAARWSRYREAAKAV
jgi:hypothetical protein